jgi:hypothetical protein
MRIKCPAGSHWGAMPFAAMRNFGNALQILDVAWYGRAGMMRPLECAPRKISIAIGSDKGVRQCKLRKRLSLRSCMVP